MNTQHATRDTQHSPRQRVLSALKGEDVGRPAIGSGTSVVTADLMERCGVRFPEAHLDGELMARLTAAAGEVLGYDILMPYFSTLHEAAALGLPVEWGDPNTMPRLRVHPYASAEQISIPPDFLSRPPIRVVLDAIGHLRRQFGEEYAVLGKVFGPWTLAYHLFGAEEFLIRIVDAPDEVRRILERLKEIAVLFGQAQIDAGADALLLGDHCSADLCSPATYRDFLQPVHRELAQRIPCPLVLHTCGHTADRIALFADTGVACFHIDTVVPAVEAARLSGGRMRLMGGVNNPQSLLRFDREVIAGQVRDAIAAGVAIIGPECAVPLNCPYESLVFVREEVLRQTAAGMME